MREHYLTAFITIRTKSWFNEVFVENEYNRGRINTDKINISSVIVELPLIAYMFYSIEFGENNKPHQHIIVAFKNIIGYNKEFLYNLKNYIVMRTNETDIVLELMLNFVEYKNRFKYIFKEKNEYKYISFFTNDLKEYYDNYTKSEFKTYELIFNESKWDYLPSYSNINNIYDEHTLINMLNFYFKWKSCKMYKKRIYKKIIGTMVSYKKYLDINEIVNNLIKIYNELLKIFGIQIEGLDMYMLKTKFFSKMEQILEKTTQIIVEEVNLKFDIVEFTDGVYFLSQDKFVPKEVLKGYEMEYIGTVKYYKKTYKHLKLPDTWRNLIEETLNDSIEAQSLFVYFATLFNKSDELLGKKRIMYVKGAPSTGKTTLLVKIIYNFFGEENVGTIAGNSNFSLEGLLCKELAVIDEAEHLKINTGVLLKITESYNPQAVERKYKQASFITNLSIIFLSNNNIKIENDVVRAAFEKRIRMFEFKKCLPESVDIYKKIIKNIIKEEINIIVYCNKIFFKECMHRKDKRPRIGNKQTILKIINKKEDSTKKITG